MNLTREQKISRILAALRAKPMTRQEITAATGIPLESVCGRCNELLRRGKIGLAGSVLCRETGQFRELLRATVTGSSARETAQ